MLDIINKNLILLKRVWKKRREARKQYSPSSVFDAFGVHYQHRVLFYKP